MVPSGLKLNEIVKGEVRSFVNYDEPALSAVFAYCEKIDNSVIDEEELLHWYLGYNNPYFVFGISVSKKHKTIRIVELVLYGDKIYSLPEQVKNTVNNVFGIPKFDISIWKENKTNIIDTEELFKIQANGKCLRIEISNKKVAIRNYVTKEIIFEFDGNNYLCGIVFNELPEKIVQSLIKRYKRGMR